MKRCGTNICIITKLLKFAPLFVIRNKRYTGICILTTGLHHHRDDNVPFDGKTSLQKRITLKLETTILQLVKQINNLYNNLYRNFALKQNNRFLNNVN